jgi:hypothetical protein
LNGYFVDVFALQACYVMVIHALTNFAFGSLETLCGTMIAAEAIVLPCDLPQWSEIKMLYNDILCNKSPECMITALQKVYETVHCRNSVSAIERSTVAARPKIKNIFSGLKTSLDEKATPDEYDEFFNTVLPTIIRRAIDIEKFADGLRCKNTS